MERPGLFVAGCAQRGHAPLGGKRNRTRRVHYPNWIRNRTEGWNCLPARRTGTASASIGRRSSVLRRRARAVTLCPVAPGQCFGAVRAQRERLDEHPGAVQRHTTRSGGGAVDVWSARYLSPSIRSEEHTSELQSPCNLV